MKAAKKKRDKKLSPSAIKTEEKKRKSSEENKKHSSEENKKHSSEGNKKHSSGGENKKHSSEENKKHSSERKLLEKKRRSKSSIKEKNTKSAESLKRISPLKSKPIKPEILLSYHRHSSSYIPELGREGMSWVFALFLLINCAFGEGALNLPYAYHKIGGIYIATAVQIAMIILMFTTALIPIYCAKAYNCDTLHSVIIIILGSKAYICSVCVILFTCMAICITHLVVIGDQFENLFIAVYATEYCTTWYLQRKFLIFVTSTIFILPLCYSKHLHFLKYTSPESVVDVFTFIPVFTFAYHIHDVAIPVYAHMNDKDIGTLVKTISLTMMILFITYCLTAGFAYYTFGNEVRQDVIMGYEGTDPKVIFGMAALIIKMIITYPQFLHCGRDSVEDLYVEFHKMGNIGSEKIRHRIITTCWFITTMTMSIFTPNIGIVIKILGCLATFHVFIIPGFCLMRMGYLKDENLENYNNKLMIWMSGGIIAFGFFIFGVVIADAMTHMFFNHHGEHHSKSICSIK